MKVSFPLIPILGLIFVTLKLTGSIAWSWWWVLSPFWLGPAIILACWLLALAFVAALGAFAWLVGGR